MEQIVTVSRLKDAIREVLTRIKNKISTGDNASLASVNVSEAVTVTAGDDDHAVLTITPSSEETSRIDIVLSDEDGERTVATCNDANQRIRAKTLASGCIIGFDGENTSVVSFPGVALPSGYTTSDPEYKGEIVTTRSDRMELRTFSQLHSDEPVLVPLYSGSYNQGSGSKLRFTHVPMLTNGVLTVNEYWLDLTIPSNVNSEDVSISFPSAIRWAVSQPDWASSIGDRFLIHVVNNIASIVMQAKANSSGNTPSQVATVADGTLAEAIAYAASPVNTNRVFQWILRTTDSNGNSVVKPIWHTANGVFIDALGAVMSDDV